MSRTRPLRTGAQDSGAATGLALEVRGLAKSFGATSVLRGVSLVVKTGEVRAIIGPSGAGKSTLLRCINALEQPDAGEIVLEGKPFGQTVNGRWVRPRESDLRRGRATMPMVFQRFNLFAHKTVLGNVVEGQVAVLKRSRRQADEKAIEVLRLVGLADKIGRYPSQLSGGEQQRVGIARALAMDPSIILFDEPTSSLDPELTGEVLDVIRRLATGGLTMLLVTHEMAFAKQIADIVSFMEGGVIVEEGRPGDIFERPQNARTKSFISAILR
jgi:polar amino acid transport system ATP-binding protein